MATPMEDRVAGRPLTEKSRASVERNARLSTTRRAKRPLPPTREDADELFRPASPDARALGTRLYRMNELGLLHPEGRPITQGEAHLAILDALYPIAD